MALKILFLTAQSPYPPRLGGALRNYGMISGLAENHDVSLLSLLEPGQPHPQETQLASMCDEIVTVPVPPRSRGQRVRDLLAGHADMARRLWSVQLVHELRDLLSARQFDVLHLGGLEMAPYLRVVREMAFGGMVVFDDYNAEAALQKRIFEVDLRTPRRWHAALYSLVQWLRLTRFETEVCRMADRVLAVSTLDAELLRALDHETPVTVIPNAIQVGSYHLDGMPTDLLPHPALVFTGKMDYRPNVDAALWFADEVLPSVQAQFPEVHFAIVGQKPHARLDPLRDRPGVIITGVVEDIKPYIASAVVYVVPMRMGSGTRFKVLEAMAMRRPIVSTTLGAEGLDAHNGRHLLVADNPSEFAGAIAALLTDESKRNSMGQAAYAFVADNYDWKTIIPRLEAVYESA